jgi:hypothetical protein
LPKPEKDRDWTGLQLEKTGPPVAVSAYFGTTGCRLCQIGHVQKTDHNQFQPVATGHSGHWGMVNYVSVSTVWTAGESGGKGGAATRCNLEQEGCGVVYFDGSDCNAAVGFYDFHISNGQSKQTAENKGSTTDKSH